MRKLFYLFILIWIMSSELYAQPTATSSVTATIILPVGTQQSTEMEFGKFSAIGIASEVKLFRDGLQIVKGKIKLDNQSDGAAAIFNVTDINLCAYSVTLAYDPVIINKKYQRETMGIDLYRINMPPMKNNTKESSTIIAIGANLRIAPAQLPGTYFSTNPYYLTVNYN